MFVYRLYIIYLYCMMDKDKKVGKEKRVVDGELEMLLNEIPLVTSLGVSPSNSTSFSGGFGFGSSEDGSSSSLTHPFDDTMNPTMDPVVLNNDHMLDDLHLSEKLYRMNIGMDPDGIGTFGFHDPYSNRINSVSNVRNNDYPNDGFSPFGFSDQYSNRIINPCNVGNNYYPCDGFNSDYEAFRAWLWENSKVYDGCSVNNRRLPYLMDQTKGHGRAYSNQSMTKPCFNNGYYLSQKYGAAYNPSVDIEESFILQGKSLNYVVDNGCDRSKFRKKNYRSEMPMGNWNERRVQVHKRDFLGYSSLGEVQGCIYHLAKDQQGCRFLQRIFDEGTHQDLQIIFNEIIDPIVELMMNPFGNYLVQKLLDVCSEQQRMQIVLKVTQEPEELIRICLNTHGTRVMQKLIETLQTRQEISFVTRALEPGFLNLIKDPNGNHVVQRCLQCLGNEHNMFIFNAAAKFCVSIATHQHGCCVLNRCIAHSSGEHRKKLIAEISANGFLIAQDPYGNYVIQYIIELKIPSVAANLLSQFEGHYVYLSMQKFGSHVVEKCLRFLEDSRSRIVTELLSVPRFDQLIQDPFANYVISSALKITKGPLRDALVEAVQPHTFLRTNPYCKKLFSRNLLKK